MSFLSAESLAFGLMLGGALGDGGRGPDLGPRRPQDRVARGARPGGGGLFPRSPAGTPAGDPGLPPLAEAPARRAGPGAAPGASLRPPARGPYGPPGQPP